MSRSGAPDGGSSADFYAVELSGGGRYLRRVKNFSDEGLLLENPLADAFPGQHVELELPRQGGLPAAGRGRDRVRHAPKGASASALTSPLPSTASAAEFRSRSTYPLDSAAWRSSTGPNARGSWRARSPPTSPSITRRS